MAYGVVVNYLAVVEKYCRFLLPTGSSERGDPVAPARQDWVAFRI